MLPRLYIHLPPISSFYDSSKSNLSFHSSSPSGRTIMASDGSSWADQWGEGGFGAMTDDNTKPNKDAGVDKKTTASGGFGKAKAAAMAGAQKVKNSTSMSIKWVKSKCQKKTSTT